jgi:hypothetical protein
LAFSRKYLFLTTKNSTFFKKMEKKAKKSRFAKLTKEKEKKFFSPIGKSFSVIKNS